MSITVEEKARLIKAYATKENDTGSPEVQVAMLTDRISQLTEHLKTGDITSAKGREVWRDERTKLLWSSKVGTAMNWCRASGSNFITNNPTAQGDSSSYCDNATYQNTGTGPATKGGQCLF